MLITHKVCQLWDERQVYLEEHQNELSFKTPETLTKEWVKTRFFARCTQKAEATQDVPQLQSFSDTLNPSL
ncbi:MAG: hypothetical protein K0S08_1930 [Gammaproteobacteria bacterium]|jgi:hypothetical protein|nr:hypothetical protein [Gammaproteobacteria bacterium]